jgi:hypothetical protein
MKESRTGQVLVEMLLVLPVFLTIVFTIMEMGYMAFQMILLNHATYEVARVGGMTHVTSSGGMMGGCGAYLPGLMKRIIQSASVACSVDPTTQDMQANVLNHDLIVTGSNPIKFIFPLSSILMSSKLLCPQGPGGGWCTISATVRMPIEQPLAY